MYQYGNIYTNVSCMVHAIESGFDVLIGKGEKLPSAADNLLAIMAAGGL